MRKLLTLFLILPFLMAWMPQKAEAKIWTRDLVDKVTLDSGYKFSLCTIDLKYDVNEAKDAAFLILPEKDFSANPDSYPCNKDSQEDILFANITLHFSQTNWGGGTAHEKLLQFQNKLYSVGRFGDIFNPDFVDSKGTYANLGGVDWFSTTAGLAGIRGGNLINVDPGAKGDFVPNSTFMVIHDPLTGKFVSAIFVFNNVVYKLSKITSQVTTSTTLVDYTQPEATPTTSVAPVSSSAVKAAVIFVYFTYNNGIQPTPTISGNDIPADPGKPTPPPMDPTTHAHVTVDIVRNILEGTGMYGFPSVNTFYNEVTYGKIQYAFDYFGWYQAPIAPPQTCDLSNLMTLSDSIAESHGANLTPYQARMYIFPGISSCQNHAFGGKDSSKTYSFVFMDDFLLSDVYSHELGHALNLSHAARWECSTPNDYTNNCIINERGDFYDIMGGQGYFNAPHQISLGLIQNQQIQTITQSGNYTIVPIELETGSKTLKILKPDTRQRQCDGSNCNDYQDYYYVEYRRPIGIDSKVVFDKIGEAIDKEGIEIHIWDGFTSVRDFTKLVNPQNPVLHDGQSFYDAINNIKITQISHDDSKVIIKVELGSSVTEHSP